MTHHYACDCREAYFVELIDENARLQRRVETAETLLDALEAHDLHELRGGRLEVTEALLRRFWEVSENG